MAKAELLNPVLPACHLAEGPHWDAANGVLYWVDITGQAVHRYHPATQRYDSMAMPSTASFVVLDEAGGLIVGGKDALLQMSFGDEPHVLAKPDNFHPGCRFNDGKCDPQGRLWAGTMHLEPDQNPPAGQMYRYDGQSLQMIEDGIYISNGFGWSPDGGTMYFTDTIRRTIFQYDYDQGAGMPSNKRVFYTFDGPGRPDGLTVDSQGRVLSASWPGWGINILTPGGKMDGRIELPVPQVSSCTFGGADMKMLFITTAAELSPEEKAAAPLSGQLFAIEMDVPGLPNNRFKS